MRTIRGLTGAGLILAMSFTSVRADQQTERLVCSNDVGAYFVWEFDFSKDAVKCISRGEPVAQYSSGYTGPCYPTWKTKLNAALTNDAVIVFDFYEGEESDWHRITIDRTTGYQYDGFCSTRYNYPDGCGPRQAGHNLCRKQDKQF